MKRGTDPERSFYRDLDKGLPVLLFMGIGLGGVFLSRLFGVGLGVGLLLAALLVFGAIVYLLFLVFRGPRQYGFRVRNGLCVSCGYDLRASLCRCPECGKRIDEWLYGSMGSRATRSARRQLRKERLQ